MELFALGVVVGLGLAVLIHWLIVGRIDDAADVLPPRDGHIIVTKSDGSQHYRRTRATMRADGSAHN